MTVVLFARGLGDALPRALRGLGAEAEAFGDHFAAGAADSDWLADAAERGWCVVTGDARVREAPAARALIESAGIGCFVLATGGTRLEQVGSLTRAWQRIQDVAAQTPRPFVCAIRADGAVEGAPSRRARAAPAPKPARPRRSRLQPRLPGLE